MGALHDLLDIHGRTVEGDGADQAKHIFRCLRALDEQGDAVVYARCPQKDGLSMAVYNRLIRAAAFRVIKL